MSKKFVYNKNVSGNSNLFFTIIYFDSNLGDDLREICEE